jgi:hypothetical protein
MPISYPDEPIVRTQATVSDDAYLDSPSVGSGSGSSEAGSPGGSRRTRATRSSQVQLARRLAAHSPPEGVEPGSALHRAYALFEDDETRPQLAEHYVLDSGTHRTFGRL